MSGTGSASSAREHARRGAVASRTFSLVASSATVFAIHADVGAGAEHLAGAGEHDDAEPSVAGRDRASAQRRQLGDHVAR